jgi:hypothetical protein
MEEFRIECEFGDMTQAYKNGTKFYVDYDNFIHHVMDYRFCRDNNGYVMYSSRKDGLCHKYLHRIILDCPDNMMIDHIDHNKLNNMKSNLRICTNQQNNMNASKRKDNTSGVIGVCWYKANEKWMARIKLNSKDIHLGYFDSLEDAAQARKEAEIKYFGEYRNKDNEK